MAASCRCPGTLTVHAIHPPSTAHTRHTCLHTVLHCRVAVMEACLNWRHLAPTAPDTLTCYPYHDCDPFILQSAPHVMFVGNQPEFKVGSATGECLGTRGEAGTGLGVGRKGVKAYTLGSTSLCYHSNRLDLCASTTSGHPWRRRHLQHKTRNQPNQNLGAMHCHLT